MDLGEEFEKAVSVFTVGGQTSGRLFFFPTYFWKLCQISKGFHKIRNRLSGKFLNQKWTVGGYRGGDYILPINVSCNQHLLTLTSGFYDSTVTWYVLFFSEKYLLCILAILTFSGHSHDLISTLYRENKRKIQLLYCLYTIHVCLLSEIINDGVRMQNKKQKQISFNVFHMWEELLFFSENYKLLQAMQHSLERQRSTGPVQILK